MRVFQVGLPHFYQIDSADQTAVMSRLVSLFAGPLSHCRFLSLVTPASLAALERARRRLALQLPEARFRRGLMEEVQLINTWAGQGTMRQTQHFLIDFGQTLTAEDLAGWQVQARPCYPTWPLPGAYAEATDHMQPVTAGKGIDHSRPRFTVLASYQLTRTWAWRQPLAQVITTAAGPLLICVDVRKIHPERVTASAEFWQGMVLNGQDRNAVLTAQEAEAALSVSDEAVHHVRVLFLVMDQELRALRQRVDQLRKAVAPYLKVDSLRGYQAAVARLFGPSAKPPGIPAGHFNCLSRLPAVCTGMWGVGRAQPTDGFYIGLSVDEVATHVHYLNWSGNDPFHGLILGRTGKGKTVAAQALAWRLAEQGVQTVMLEPQGHSRRLLALAQGEDVSYHRLSYEESQLNILDVVYADPSEQYDHVISLLRLLLDPLGDNPRRLSNAEIAAVRRALQLTYARYKWGEELLGRPEMTPTLATFCHKLYQVAGQPAALLAETAVSPTDSPIATAARRLAEEIQSLYVTGDYAPTFNAPTNIDLTLSKRLVLFDFSRVPDRRRALFYYAVLAGMNLQIRRQPRRRVVLVDEAHYMNQEASLMSFMATMVKTVRTYGAGVVMIDQDLEAFIGVEGAQAESMATGTNVTAGQFIINNVTWTIAFGLKRDAAYRLAAHYKDEILPSHAEFLARMGSDEAQGKGMAVVRAGGKADIVYFQCRPMEVRHLFGS